MAIQPQPVVFRPRSMAVTAIWAVLAGGLTILATLFVLTNLGLHISPSPGLASAILIVAVISTLSRPRPIGLDRNGLHFGSPNKGYVVPWSDIAGVKALPRRLVVPERIRIALIHRGLAPGYLAIRRWGLRVLPAGEVEVQLGYGQSSVEIADEIRRFIDAYG